MPLVTAVIPAYNEAERIGAVVERALSHVDEVIVVDDASEDATGAVAANAGAHVVRMPTNQGYIAAIKAGFARAEGEIVVTLDGDGELPPEEIPRLVGPVVRGDADMVQGARPHAPRPSERLIKSFVNLFAPAGDTGTGMRAMRVGLARDLTISGACICGTLTLEVLRRGGTVVDLPIQLAPVNKPRGIAWYHIGQFGHVVVELTRYLLR